MFFRWPNIGHLVIDLLLYHSAQLKWLPIPQQRKGYEADVRLGPAWFALRH